MMKRFLFRLEVAVVAGVVLFGFVQFLLSLWRWLI